MIKIIPKSLQKYFFDTFAKDITLSLLSFIILKTNFYAKN